MTLRHMKLIYCSSITLPSGLANRWQSLAMAKAFYRKLGDDFYFGVSRIGEGSDKNMRIIKELDRSRILIFGRTKSYFLALRYLKFIRKNKIEYIYCREPRLLLFLAFYSKLFFLFRRPKFIYEVHMVYKDFLDKVIHKLLLRWVDSFTFITKYLRDFYIENYQCPKSRTLIIPDSVDLEIFDLDLTIVQARQELDLPRDKKIIGCFGRFRTMGMEKGLKTILESLKFLDDNILFLAMGGKSRDIKYYANMAKQLGVEHKVLFMSSHPQYELAFYQKACDILLMLYPFKEHYAYYMSPMKMCEYMASKRPIITSDLPSVREILSETSAFFVQPDNAKDLATIIKRVLENQGFASKIAQQAFEDVKQYTWQERVRKILSFLKVFKKED